VVRTAEAVWAAARDTSRAPAARVARLGLAADALARLRADGDERWAVLARDVDAHAQTLAALGLRPADVYLDTGLPAATRWALRRLTLVGAVQFVLSVLVILLFWIPYRVTGLIAARTAPDLETVSTYRVLGGALFFSVWIAALSALAGWRAGWLAGVLSLVLLPCIAVSGMYALEHWRLTVDTARRWLATRRGDPRIVALRERQIELSQRLDDALAAYTTHA
jgi:hypothetical protein